MDKKKQTQKLEVEELEARVAPLVIQNPQPSPTEDPGGGGGGSGTEKAEPVRQANKKSCKVMT